MAGFESFRETYLSLDNPSFGKVIRLSTLDEEEVNSLMIDNLAGGYTYQDSNIINSPCSNRFLVWRVLRHRVLLSEHSLNHSLSHASMCLELFGALGGVSAGETDSHVIILIPACGFLHRVAMVHPISMDQDAGGLFDQDELPSVLANAVPIIESVPFITPSGATGICASYVRSTGECVYALGLKSGSIALFQLPSVGVGGEVIQRELRSNSMMRRLWSGFGKLTGQADSPNVSLSMTFCRLPTELILLSLDRDLKIRVWNVATDELLLEHDLKNADLIPDYFQLEDTTDVSVTHKLKMVASNMSPQARFMVCLTSKQCRQFLFLRLEIVKNYWKLVKEESIFDKKVGTFIDAYASPERALYIYDDDDENQFISCLSRQGNSQPSSVLLVDCPPFTIEPTPGDLFEYTYIERLFHSGVFGEYILKKTMQDCRKKLGSRLPTQRTQVETLMLQLFLKAHTILSIFNDPRTGLLILIKEGAVSILRPALPIEHLQLSEELCPEALSAVTGLTEENQLRKDIMSLSEGLQVLGHWIEDEGLATEFEIDIEKGVVPADYADVIAQGLHVDSISDCLLADRIEIIRKTLGSISNIGAAVEGVFMLLDFSLPKELQDKDIPSTSPVGKLLASDEMLFSLAMTVEQMAESFYRYSRNLLLYLAIIHRLPEVARLNNQMKARLKGDLMLQAQQKVYIGLLLKWYTKTSTHTVPRYIRRRLQRQLDFLRIRDSSIKVISPRTCTLASVLLIAHQRPNVISALHLADHFEQSPAPLKSLTIYAKSFLELLWPLDARLQWLDTWLHYGQIGLINEHARLCLLDIGTCDPNTNRNTMVFLRGLAYLNLMEPVKAAHCFTQCANSGLSEDLLRRISDENVAQFYFRIVDLLEIEGEVDLVIKICHNAVGVVGVDNPLAIRFFKSRIFKLELEMGHFEEAYLAMLDNQETAAESAHLLVTKLCEQKQLNLLLSLPYREDRACVLSHQVARILTHRARCALPTQHNYYDLLYAFHMRSSCYRKAGCVMYEYSHVLGQLGTGLRLLQKQAKCLLAAVMAFTQVPEDRAWTLIPKYSNMPSDDEEGEDGEVDMGGEEVVVVPVEEKDEDVEERLHRPDEDKFTIVTLKDMQKMYHLMYAKLRLVHATQNLHLVDTPMTPEDAVVCLATAGFLDTAMSLCKLFDLPLDPVFEALLEKIYQVSQNTISEEDLQNWLVNTNCELLCRTVQDQLWQLLIQYLEENSTDGRYYRFVTEIFLSYQLPLPTPVVNAYKRLNTAELLRTYLKFDLLNEAFDLAIKYMNSVMDCGPEHYGISGTPTFASQPVYIAFPALELVRENLEDAADDVAHEAVANKLLHEFDMTLDKLYTFMEKVSTEKEEHYRSTALVQRY